MKKIIFNNETIKNITDFLQTHTLQETCNRFTIKRDTLCKLIFEHNIKTPHIKKSISLDYSLIPQQKINEVCNLFRNTKMKLKEIKQQTNLPYYVFQEILDRNFSKKQQDERSYEFHKSAVLSNKEKGCYKNGLENPRYKGIIEDGKGYQLILKPEWYEGRKGCKHIYYHHYVMCKSLGIKSIPKGYCVHHIDRNKHNNDISNLCLLTIQAHLKLHWLENNLIKGVETIQNGVGKNSETPNNN